MIKKTAILAAAAMGLTFGLPSSAQVVDPTSIFIPDSSPVCNEGSELFEDVCITLPPGSIVDKVDVFFLFDDTGSFASFVPTVTGIFSALVTDLETALPGVEFGFGVGRFEDYGGPGTGFSGENTNGRPFVLNQPIVTAADAGGTVARDALITTALANTAAGFGGDGPESAISEGLYQVATGFGFDGDGDSQTAGTGGLQPAGLLATQTAADDSGDVPSFATLDPGVVSSGSIGGAGYRSAALKLVILATDVCPIAVFDSEDGIPANIVGTGSSEPVAEFACTSTDPGTDRFGFASDSLTFAGNTIAGAVAPLGAATLPDTVAALNGAGIRVMGMGPSAGPVPTGSGPSSSEDPFLSALARLTGAVDAIGDPLVFDVGAGDAGASLTAAIVAAVEATATLPIDISLEAEGEPAGISVSTAPPLVADVPPGGQACFDATISGVGSPANVFDLVFKDAASGAALGTIPVEVGCLEEIVVAVDIKPQSCPNPINCRKKGVLPVAILGTGDFDVTQIDPATVRLAGVAPERSALEDVATPFEPFTGKLDCDGDCTVEGPDGLLDLTLKFDTQAVLAAAGLANGDRFCAVLTLTGNLSEVFGGTPIVGEDVVRYQCK